MKKIILILLVGIMLCLCGCSADNPQLGITEPMGEPIKGDYLGYWEHTDYPDAYSVIVYEQTVDSLSFIVQAVRTNSYGQSAQMAHVRKENIKCGSGEAYFNFIDSFGNSGLANMQIEAERITFNFNVTGSYQGNWCIDAGNGSYKKVRGLSELDGFNADDYELFEPDEESVFENWDLDRSDALEGKSYMWYGKYYLAGNDLEHDKNTYYAIASGGTMEQKMYGRTTEGKYYMFDSDKADYDFKMLFVLNNGEDYMLYGKSNIPDNDPRRDKKDDITFYIYSLNGSMNFYGRYLNETYIGTESAVRSANK